MQAYEAQLERLKQALNVDSDTAFSQVLDISQGSVSGAKKRGQIPRAWFFYVFDKTKVSIDWLITGTGPMRLNDVVSDSQQAIGQPTVPIKAAGQCPRCTDLERELEKKSQYIEEINKNLVEALQNSMLLTEKNGELRLENLKLTHQLDTTRQMCREYAAKPDAAEPSLFVDPKNTSSIDPLHIR